MVASLSARISVGDDEEPHSTITAPVSGSSRSDANGLFSIELDAAGELIGPVTLRISAPNGTLVRALEVGLDAIEAETIEIPIEPAPTLTIDESELPGLGERLRITGRVVDEAGRQVPAGLPVVIWGVDRRDDERSAAPRPIVLAETQVDGAFGGDWPEDRLLEAFGRVASGPPIAVPLDAGGRLVRTILLVTRVTDEQTAECVCTQTPPRAPDPVDLTTNPSAYSRDLGVGCVELDVPNRALEEYTYSFVVRTSEPAVRGLTLGRRRMVPPDLLVDLLGVSLAATALEGARLSSTTLGRTGLALDVDTARQLVRTDRVPHPEVIERAAWLSEVSSTKALIDASLRGGSTRRMLDADAAIDWDDTPTIHLSVELAHGHILHYREVWRADGYSLGDLLHSLPLAPGQRRQIAVVDWDRQTETRQEQALELEEALDALIERDRDIREIVGTDLHETTAAGSRNRTWGVAGGLGAGLMSGAFGIFGGISGGASGSSSEAWQRSARQLSASSLQLLRDRIAQRASSVRTQRSTVVQTVAQGESQRVESEVVANYNRCHAVTIQYFEVLRHFLVTHELADVDECVFVPFPITPFNRAKALRWREPLTRFLADEALRPGFDAIERVADDWVGWDFPESRFSQAAPIVLEGELRISFVLPRPRDAEDGSFQLAEWEAYRDALPGFARHVFTRFIENAVAANKSVTAARDEAFLRDVAPAIAARIVNRLRFAYVRVDGGETEISLDGTLVSDYHEGLPLYVSLQPAGDLPGVAREDIAYFKLWYEGEPLPPEANVIVHGGRLRYRTEHITALLFDDPRILDDLGSGDPVLVPTPTSRRELRDPRQEDLELAERLVGHLDDNLEFYHQVLWHSLDAQRRFMLLDAIEVPGQGGRSVASVCINELLGIVGNSLVLPVAPGQRLDPSVSATDEQGNPVDPRHPYAVPPAPPLRISVPTRGVHVEAVAGECNSCERSDDARYWRWSTEGLLAPPPIQGPIDTGTRAAEEPALTPTPLPTPLVQIQNAPAVPDPFGLRAAFELLARPELFRDVTGLEGTQKNAIAAFDAALSAASAMGAEAAKLARQAELSKTSARMIDRLERAVDDELLTPEAAKRLTEAVLGGLAGREEPKAEDPLQDETVESAVEQLSQAESGSLRLDLPSESLALAFEDAPVVGSSALVPLVLTEVPEEHGWVDGPLLVERGFDGRPNTPDAGDLAPYVITLDLIDFMFRTQEFPAPLSTLESVGAIERTDGPEEYRIRRPVHIVYPSESQESRKLAGDGRVPVVVIQHGAHRPVDGTLAWVNSHLGYEYLQEELARRGIVSISVSADAVNWLDGTLVAMRAHLFVSALDTLRALHRDPSSIFHERLDFSKVGLVGHSRGGDAAVKAAELISAPLRPRYKTKFVCALAPTDFTGRASDAQQHTALEPRDTPFFTVLYGTQDGDVSGADGAEGKNGTGFRHYDRATTNKSMLFVKRCTHNRFNDVWMADTGDELGIPSGVAVLTRKIHRDVLTDYVSALAQWQLLGDASNKDLFDGTRVTQPIDVSVQWSFGTKVLSIDDMEDLVRVRTLHDATVEVFSEASIASRVLNDETAHQTAVLLLEPSSGGATPGLELDLPASRRDWTRFDRVALRAAPLLDLTDDTTIAQGSMPSLELTLEDGAGVRETISLPTSSGTLPDFHLAFVWKALITGTTPVGTTTTQITTKSEHGLATGDTIKLVWESVPFPIEDQVTVVDALTFTIPRASEGDLKRGLVMRRENATVHRMETFAAPFARSEADDGSALDRSDVRRLELRLGPDFPYHVVVDSIELIED